MGTINLDSSFIRWDMTLEEQEQGQILNPLTKQCIQNLLSMAAEERIRLPFLEENKQRDAELQGQIRSFQLLLDLSNAAEQRSRDRMLAEQQLKQFQNPNS